MGLFFIKILCIGAAMLFTQGVIASEIQTLDEGAFTFSPQYRVLNQWGGDDAPWHLGGTWQIGNRKRQPVIAMSVRSSDHGATLHGTMRYLKGGKIGFRARAIGNNTYDVENQWGGPDAPWQPDGTWRLGGREDKRLMKIQIRSRDKGKTLTGTIRYQFEGEIGFRAQRMKVAMCQQNQQDPSRRRIVLVNQEDIAKYLKAGAHFAFGGYCYAVLQNDKNATRSESICQEKFRGHLASIHSEKEDNFLSNLLDPKGLGGISARIGGVAPNGFCCGRDAKYAWTDGTAWDYQNWRPWLEPNCTGAPASIQFHPNSNGNYSGWNDVPSADPLGKFICKYLPH